VKSSVSVSHDGNFEDPFRAERPAAEARLSIKLDTVLTYASNKIAETPADGRAPVDSCLSLSLSLCKTDKSLDDNYPSQRDRSILQPSGAVGSHPVRLVGRYRRCVQSYESAEHA